MLHLSIAIMGFGAVGSVCCAGLLDVPMSWRRVGGLLFWSVGRIGGSDRWVVLRGVAPRWRGSGGCVGWCVMARLEFRRTRALRIAERLAAIKARHTSANKES